MKAPGTPQDSRAFRIHAADNVATLVDDASPGPLQVFGTGASDCRLAAREPIARGHKVALTDLPAGAPVVKFGACIGHTTRPVSRGDWVHLHNLASDLDERSAHLDLQTGVSPENSSAYA